MTTPLVQLYLDRSKAPLMLRCHSESKDPSAHSAAIRGPCTQIRFLSFEMMSWSRWKATSERFSASSLPTLSDLHIPATTYVDPTAPDFALFPPPHLTLATSLSRFMDLLPFGRTSHSPISRVSGSASTSNNVPSCCSVNCFMYCGLRRYLKTFTSSSAYSR